MSISKESTRRAALEVLTGHVWHTTSAERFQGILQTGAIEPEPASIPNEERWKTGGGEKYYPFVRFLGGVSLFDLRNFEPSGYSNKYPLSSWQTFIPYNDQWEETVWIKINIHALGDAFISGENIRLRWKSDDAHAPRTFMPLIEGACLGPVPRHAFETAYTISAAQPVMREILLPPSGQKHAPKPEI